LSSIAHCTTLIGNVQKRRKTNPVAWYLAGSGKNEKELIYFKGKLWVSVRPRLKKRACLYLHSAFHPDGMSAALALS